MPFETVSNKILTSAPLRTGGDHLDALVLRGWLKTIQQELKSNTMSLNVAIVVAQNRPLMSTFGTLVHVRNEWKVLSKNKLVVCFEHYCGGFNADVFQCRLLSEPPSRQSRTDRYDIYFTMSERARDRCQLSCQVCTGVSHHGSSFCRRQRQVISFNSLNAMYRKNNLLQLFICLSCSCIVPELLNILSDLRQRCTFLCFMQLHLGRCWLHITNRVHNFPVEITRPLYKSRANFRQRVCNWLPLPY